MTIQVFIASLIALWLITVAGCLLALRWSISATPRRFWPGVILSVLGMLISYLGLSHLHVASSQTTNGKVDWRIDSKWFFIASLALGALALANTLWKKWTPPHAN